MYKVAPGSIFTCLIFSVEMGRMILNLIPSSKRTNQSKTTASISFKVAPP